MPFLAVQPHAVQRKSIAYPLFHHAWWFFGTRSTSIQRTAHFQLSFLLLPSKRESFVGWCKRAKWCSQINRRSIYPGEFSMCCFWHHFIPQFRNFKNSVSRPNTLLESRPRSGNQTHAWDWIYWAKKMALTVGPRTPVCSSMPLAIGTLNSLRLQRFGQRRWIGIA